MVALVDTDLFIDDDGVFGPDGVLSVPDLNMEILSTESELLKLHSSSASLVTSGLSLKDNPFGIGLCLYETDFDLGKNPGSSVDGSFTDSSIDWLPFLTTGEFLVKRGISLGKDLLDD
jgi:hypothetical protein